jgi:hypothetical protein
MKKKLITAIIGIIMVLATLLAAKAMDFKIDMKTNDIYTAQFNIANNVDVNGTLKNCIPYINDNFEDQEWVEIKPERFDLAYGTKKDVIITFTYPPTGYYTGKLGVRCERYYHNDFVGIYDIISQQDTPKYYVIVSLAGAGQSYSINNREYLFISKPGLTEKATFTIANTGTVDLPVRFDIPISYNGIISIDPVISTLNPREVQTYTIHINVPKQFNNFTTNISIYIGDYKDTFTITGEIESLATTGAAIQSIAIGSAQVAGLKIPLPIIAIAIIIGIALLIKSQKPKKMKKK